MPSSVTKRGQLAIVAKGGRWMTRFRGKQAEFVDRNAALQAAILQAFQCSKDGLPTQVVTVSEAGKLKILWTYGVDPDPIGGLPIETAATSQKPPVRGARPR
jgi:hypothetical protein